MSSKTSSKEWHYEHDDHNSFDQTSPGITNDNFFPEECRALSEEKAINLREHSLEPCYDTEDPLVRTSSPNKEIKRNHCGGKGWITRDNFLPHIQTTDLKVVKEIRKVPSDTGRILPCALEERGWEIISLDPYAYVWDFPDHFAISMLESKTYTW